MPEEQPTPWRGAAVAGRPLFEAGDLGAADDLAGLEHAQGGLEKLVAQLAKLGLQVAQRHAARVHPLSFQVARVSGPLAEFVHADSNLRGKMGQVGGS